MADINTGDLVKFNNGGSIMIGSEEILNFKEGTLRIRNPGRETLAHMFKGIFRGIYRSSDRMAELEFVVKGAKFSSSDSVWDKLCPADTGAKVTPFSMTVKRPWYRGATTPSGDEAAFTSCFLPDAPEYAEVAGNELDEVTIKIMCYDPPAPKDMWTALT